jgi:phosphate starvation-inducible protein PhoH and related proteins
MSHKQLSSYDILRNGVPKELRTFSEEELKKQRRTLKAKTPGQQEYIDAIDNNIIVLCNGVAGTGKTYIAIAKAVELLLDGKVNKIVIARPIVECDENLGFLPGELEEKIHPYMKPVCDVLLDYLSEKELKEYTDKDIIELCPLAYMRGRTFHKTALVLDEAQNATKKQLKMFLTRTGNDSKVIISGDTTQCDLPNYSKAYEELIDLFNRPPYIDALQTIQLTYKDIVRSGIVQKIIEKLGE